MPTPEYIIYGNDEIPEYFDESGPGVTCTREMFSLIYDGCFYCEQGWDTEDLHGDMTTWPEPRWGHTLWVTDSLNSE